MSIQWLVSSKGGRHGQVKHKATGLSAVATHRSRPFRAPTMPPSLADAINPNYALGMHSLPEGSDDPLRGGCQTAIESLQLTKTLQTNVLSRLNPMTFQSGCDPRRHHLTMKITFLVVVFKE